MVEFLVNNYTIVDAGGNRDTKKVVIWVIVSQRSVSRWWCTLWGSPVTTSPPASSPPSCWEPSPTSPSWSTLTTSMTGAIRIYLVVLQFDFGYLQIFLRFMGSLTALLVLASMMPVFTEGLPKASYTKVNLSFLTSLEQYLLPSSSMCGCCSSWSARRSTSASTSWSTSSGNPSSSSRECTGRQGRPLSRLERRTCTERWWLRWQLVADGNQITLQWAQPAKMIKKWGNNMTHQKMHPTITLFGTFP